MTIAFALTTALAVLASLPYWLPRSVVALRVWLFARIADTEGIAIPGGLVDDSRFLPRLMTPRGAPARRRVLTLGYLRLRGRFFEASSP